MVVALLALFVALGGTSYAVGTRINGAELKNRSVPGVKLEKHTLKGTDIDLAHLPQVPLAFASQYAAYAGTATYADDATRAGSATTATSAATATSAQTAVSASSADSVDGHVLTQIDASAGPAGSATLLDDVGGLTLEMTCAPGAAPGDVTLRASSATDDAQLGIGATGGPTQFDEYTLNPGASQPIPTLPSAAAQVYFSYQRQVGMPPHLTTGVVSGTFTVSDDDGCAAFGNADYSTTS
jgi:hypothetical protein